jgi:hypothetical protein
MAQAKHGDTVKVHYTGKLEDGTIFDTSINRDPLQFTIGEGQIIPGFEQAVVGMNPGESKTTKVPADKAYGSHHKEKVLLARRNQFLVDLTRGRSEVTNPSNGWSNKCSHGDRCLRVERDIRCQPSFGRERPDLRYPAHRARLTVCLW